MIRSAIIEAALLLLIAPSVARADDVEEARRRFVVGEEQYARGSYEEAYASYEAAYRAAPLPDFLFNMGQCQRKLGNPREALALYRRFLSMNPPEDRREIVEGIVRDILITNPEADVRPERPPQASSSSPHRRSRPAPPPERPSFFARLRAPTWITLGGAVVLAGAGGIFALRAQSGQQELDGMADGTCERDIQACLDVRDEAETWFLARDVAFVTGGAMLTLAVVLAVIDAGRQPEPEAVTIAPALGPRVAAVSLSGSF